MPLYEYTINLQSEIKHSIDFDLLRGFSFTESRDKEILDSCNGMYENFTLMMKDLEKLYLHIQESVERILKKLKKRTEKVEYYSQFKDQRIFSQTYYQDTVMTAYGVPFDIIVMFDSGYWNCQVKILYRKQTT